MINQVTGLWIKCLKSIRQPFKDHLSQMYKGEQAPPDWLLKSMTLLLPKNKDTIQPKNYRPIALQNSMYKVYTTIIAEFIMDHCERNKVIVEEQAAGKRGSWGCADQLLINKMIYKEVTQARKNLVTEWLDYQKAFDSVPHSWIIESLELAKVPPAIIKAIEQLMYKWKTQARLNGETSNIETDFISYLRGILQGDTLMINQVTGLWIKCLKSIRQPFKDHLSQMYKGEQAPPDWLLKSMTLLLPKNKDTIQPKNYRPIALQNSMYKVYTTIIAEFIMDHCERNKVIVEEQAAGKRGSWGCADQLLINKMIYKEVTQARKNLVTQARKNLVTEWLDYQKAFDSVPHSWIIESLELAKVPPAIIKAIEQLMYKWKTQARLNGETSNIETDFISYLRGILQGDTLSLILFALSVNPLPFLLRNHEGYKIKNIKKNNITNLFFVDDLKLYAQNIEKMIKILEIVTTFSHDVGMSFGVSKCTYQCIERGKQKLQNQPLEANSLIIQEIEEGDQYKYLGMDESVGIIGPLNKQRVVKEYKTSVKKIWNSELNATNKAIAHNAFAVPIITPTIGILNWTKKEISDLNVTTSKILMMEGAFHVASDIDRLYIQRSKGGHGLRSIEDMYEIRTVGMMQHLEEAAEKHSLLKLVKEHEEKSICRLGKEFIQQRKDHQNSSNAKEGTRKEHEQRWKDKETHGYLKKTLEQDAFVDEKRTNGWLNLKLTSHVEGYIAAVQERELNTKETQKRREKDIQKRNKQ